LSGFALKRLRAKLFGRAPGKRLSTARAEAFRLQAFDLEKWLSARQAVSKPTKADQDRLDTALCLLIAIRWRNCPRDQSMTIGDLGRGYMVAPVSNAVMDRLLKRGVPIDALEFLLASSDDDPEGLCHVAVPRARSVSKRS